MFWPTLTECGKCGVEKPECARCQRSGKQCVYRDEVGLLFHNETAHTSARAERLWHSRTIQNSSKDVITYSNSGISSRSTSQSQTPSLTRSLHQSLELVALARFVHDFVLQTESNATRLGYLEFVPALYYSSASGSSLSSAVEAVALANLNRRCRAPTVAAAASARYGAALRLTGEALKEPALMLTHETLLSCHLLGMYEVSGTCWA